MHEILNTFKWKPIPKLQEKLINFEKPQNFSKTPKPKIQKHEMHEIWEEKRSYQVIWSKEGPKITWVEGLEWEKWVWEVNRCG